MPGYEVAYKTYSVGHRDYRLCSLSDAEQYCDPEGEALRRGISREAWALFGQVWPSGQVLAEVMLTEGIQGRRVLELGAGLALASLVVHSRGGDMTVSDIHPLIPRFLEENLRMNALAPLRYEVADWADAERNLGAFDLIIGSDLLYERGQAELLADVIDRHCAERAEVLIVDPDRRPQAAFRAHMQEMGFNVRQTRADRRFANGETYRGSLLRFARDDR